MEPDELAAEIRPGVQRPDWSVVTSRAAREALAERMAARAGLLKLWAQALEPDEDLVWRTVLRPFGSEGRPPGIVDLARTTEIAAGQVEVLVGRLQSRDLIGLEAGSGAIRHAYPFTKSETGHRVQLGGHVLNALCAVDALGVGGMYGTDVRVRAKCRSCGTSIEVATADRGRALAQTAPADAVVWYDLSYAGNAATSCCPAIAFFLLG